MLPRFFQSRRIPDLLPPFLECRLPPPVDPILLKRASRFLCQTAFLPMVNTRHLRRRAVSETGGRAMASNKTVFPGAYRYPLHELDNANYSTHPFVSKFHPKRSLCFFDWFVELISSGGKDVVKFDFGPSYFLASATSLMSSFGKLGDILGFWLSHFEGIFRIQHTSNLSPSSLFLDTASVKPLSQLIAGRGATGICSEGFTRPLNSF